VLHNYTALHYTTLHYTTLHYTTLHYITLHYITLHYITLHYTPVLLVYAPNPCGVTLLYLRARATTSAGKSEVSFSSLRSLCMARASTWRLYVGGLCVWCSVV
jgi:hypothetical protein